MNISKMTRLSSLLVLLLGTCQNTIGAPLPFNSIAPTDGSEFLSNPQPWQGARPTSDPNAQLLPRRSERGKHTVDTLGGPSASEQHHIWTSVSIPSASRLTRRDGSSSSESSSESESESDSDSEEDGYYSDASQTQTGPSKTPKHVQFADGTKTVDSKSKKSKKPRVGKPSSFMQWAAGTAGPSRPKKSSSGSSERKKTRHSRKESDHVNALEYAQKKAAANAEEVAKQNANAAEQAVTSSKAQAKAPTAPSGAAGRPKSEKKKSSKDTDKSLKTLTWLAGGRPKGN